MVSAHFLNQHLNTQATNLTILNSTLLIQAHLIAQLRWRSIWIITERIAHGILRHKHQELIIRHRQTELRVNVLGLAGFITGTAGTVEGRARVDARGGDIAAILAR